MSDDRTHLVHADGTPFFYLADTAWNGALLSTRDDWGFYLDDRAAKGFTAIQFITHAPWTAALKNAEGHAALHADGAINCDFFNRIDCRIEAINTRGMLAVPVLAWAANFGASSRLNIGHTASADRLIPFIRYQVERLARHHVLWVLAGDGVYSCLRARKWKRVGREVFADCPDRAPVAFHPAGGTWPYRHFANETWLDLYGYQSSHSDHPRTLRWLQQGPPASLWRNNPRPTINLEPVYEGIAPIPGRPPFDDADVRRAAWWSLLNAPTAGVSYGAQGVWSWQTAEGEVLNHTGMGSARTWREAIDFPGSAQMGHIARLLAAIDWWRLRPDPDLVNQPGHHPAQWISASRTPDGTAAMIYFPRGGPVRLHVNRLSPDLTWHWYNPRTGSLTPTHIASVPTAPDTLDWVLVAQPVQGATTP